MSAPRSTPIGVFRSRPAKCRRPSPIAAVDSLTQVARLGTLQETQEIYGGGQTWRLTQIWYEVAAFRGAIRPKAGRTSPGEDFGVFSCTFQNLSFCGSQPGNVAGDYWYSWPIGQWGGRVRGDLGKKFIQVAVYEENPRNLSSKFTLGHGGATGVLIPAEIGLRTGGNGGRVGAHRVGGWISTSPMVGVVTGELRPTPPSDLSQIERTSSYGLWASAQQQLKGRSVDGASVSGVTVFLNVVQTDRRTSLIDNQVAAGMFYEGADRRRAERRTGVRHSPNPHKRPLGPSGVARGTTRPSLRNSSSNSIMASGLFATCSFAPTSNGSTTPVEMPARGVGVAGLKSELTF